MSVETLVHTEGKALSEQERVKMKTNFFILIMNHVKI